MKWHDDMMIWWCDNMMRECHLTTPTISESRGGRSVANIHRFHQEAAWTKCSHNYFLQFRIFRTATNNQPGWNISLKLDIFWTAIVFTNLSAQVIYFKTSSQWYFFFKRWQYSFYVFVTHHDLCTLYYSFFLWNLWTGEHQGDVAPKEWTPCSRRTAEL